MTGKILAGGHQGLYLIRCVGDVRLGLSVGMDSYFENLLVSGECASIIVDLSETKSIDSTSLGSLAKLSITARRYLARPPTLVSTNPDITRVLRTMGFDEVYCLVEHPLKELDELDLADHSRSMKDDEAELRRYVIDVHKALISLNGKNREAFKDLMTTLESSA